MGARGNMNTEQTITDLRTLSERIAECEPQQITLSLERREAISSDSETYAVQIAYCGHGGQGTFIVPLITLREERDGPWNQFDTDRYLMDAARALTGDETLTFGFPPRAFLRRLCAACAEELEESREDDGENSLEARGGDVLYLLGGLAAVLAQIDPKLIDCIGAIPFDAERASRMSETLREHGIFFSGFREQPYQVGSLPLGNYGSRS